MANHKPLSVVNDASNRPNRAQAEEAVRTLIQWAGDNPDREGLLDTPARSHELALTAAMGAEYAILRRYDAAATQDWPSARLLAGEGNWGVKQRYLLALFALLIEARQHEALQSVATEVATNESLRQAIGFDDDQRAWVEELGRLVGGEAEVDRSMVLRGQRDFRGHRDHASHLGRPYAQSPRPVRRGRRATATHSYCRARAGASRGAGLV